jgi:hypothetical protein
MPNFVEARTKGRPVGIAIEDYAVEDHANHVPPPLKHGGRQSTGPENGHAPLVARVRHLNDKRKPDHWRAG